MNQPALHIETDGTGPAVVLAHGFGGSARNFRPQARALRDAFRVITYDARGHARSEAPAYPHAYEFQQLVDDFARVAESAGPERVVAGGLSLGAATALAFARRSPERVRGLLLAAIPSGGARGDTPRRRWALGFADAIRDRGLDEAGAEFAWGERSRFDPQGAKLIRQGLLEHPPHALEAILRNVLSGLPSPDDIANELRALDVPTLIVVGADDADSLAPSRRLSELLPRAELAVVPGAGHVVNLAKPAEFNELTRAFLQRLG